MAASQPEFPTVEEALAQLNEAVAQRSKVPPWEDARDLDVEVEFAKDAYGRALISRQLSEEWEAQERD